MVSAGSRLGPYEIVAPIGAGGMGEVFKARDTRLGRSVAIKIVPAEFAANAQLRLRLEREAKTISQLNHPHICTLYDVGQENGDQYLVMEYVDGETLASRLRKGPLPIDQVLRYGTEIADALDKAHRHGIVHRDLKPGNVMIAAGGTKLLDFGLAKTAPLVATTDDATAHKSITAAGTMVGTFGYMSPEQIEGRDADARSDIFAFGALLYEMATGRRAFDGSTPASLIAAIMSSEPAPLRQLVPRAPAALERVIRKCLHKNPDERWQSAKDLADELRWIASEPDSGSPRPGAPRRLPWIVAAAALAILAAIAVVMWRERTPVPDGPPLILLMDSTNPERIYSSITRTNGGTNADDVTNVLRDLPVTLVKENTSAYWNREDQVIRQQPALIIVHRSAFASADAVLPDKKTSDYVWGLADRRLQAFIGYVALASPRTKFIVYSRSWTLPGFAPVNEWVGELEKRFPHLRGRLFTIEVHGQPEKSFRDSDTAARLRRLVNERLGQ